MTDTYLSGKEACQKLGVHSRTLYNWEEKGKIDTIRTPGGKRLYNVDKYIKEQTTNKIYNDDNDNDNDNEEELDKLKIIYVRVSSETQKNDLERQKLYMQKRYPKHLLIEDIGSGLNFNRRGLRKIIKYAINGKLEELVVAYKDKLARFGFELIEDLIKEYSNGRIIILNKDKDLDKEPEEELVNDMLQIMNIFTTKMNGLKKYKEKD
jgi:excisionase family DNA binding protein